MILEPVTGKGGADDGALAEFRRRCSALGLPTWRCGASGRVVAEPDEAGVAGRLLRCAALREAVERAASSYDGAEPGVVSAAEGLRFVVVPDGSGRRRAGATVCAVLSPGGVGSGVLGAACGEAGIDGESAVVALRELAGRQPSDPDGLARMLGWMRSDLASNAKDRSSIEGFSRQMSEMFEEIGLLYWLGKSMNRIDEPAQFLRSACEKLQQALPYGWVVARFVDSERVVPGLSGVTEIAGTPPCGREELVRRTLDMVTGLDPEKWTTRPCPWSGEKASCGADKVLIHPIAREGDVIGALIVGNKLDGEDITSFDTQLLDAAADYLGVFIENAGLYADQHALLMGTVQSLTASIDAKDRYTCGHSERVALMACKLARAAGMSEEEVERVRLTGLLHDVGKIGVPEQVLCKRGKLTDEEFEQIKLHPVIGYNILKDIALLSDVLPGVRYHHERWAGGGYPEGLRGEEIPFVARLLAVADSFDAMSSDRSYRAAMPLPKVLEEIQRCAGTQFEPTLAERFVTLDFSEYQEMVRRHQAWTKRAA